MEHAERFVSVCRLLNKILEHRANSPGEVTVDEDDIDLLVPALKYYRDTVDPSSGDILIQTEYRCPECGTTNEFQAQDDQVSLENTHPEVGVEVMLIQGIGQCTGCKLQLKLTQFEAFQSVGFDESAWKALYEEEYRERECVDKLRPA